VRVHQHAEAGERELTYLSLRSTKLNAAADADLLAASGKALARPTPAAEEIIADCAELLARVRGEATGRAERAERRMAEASARRARAADALDETRLRVESLEREAEAHTPPSGMPLPAHLALLALLLVGAQVVALSAITRHPLGSALTSQASGVTLGVSVLLATLGSFCGRAARRLIGGSLDPASVGMAKTGIVLAGLLAPLLAICSAAAIGSGQGSTFAAHLPLSPWPMVAPTLCVFLGAVVLAMVARPADRKQAALERELARARTAYEERRREDADASAMLAGIEVPLSAEAEIRRVVEHFRGQAAAYYSQLALARPDLLSTLNVALAEVGKRLEQLAAV
jgi:hypothetical protein